MPQVGPLEIMIIFVVALLVFGPAKLPEIGRQVGRGMRELRRLQAGLRRDLDEALTDDEGPAPAPRLPPKVDDASSAPAEPPPPDPTP
jgi:TatA/E family protein of Tat protein translocase